MSKTKTRSELIEADRINGAYDMIREQAIIHHHKYGRILIVEGWGGFGSIEGETYRYRHGSAYQLRDGDTCASLAAEQDRLGTDLEDIRTLLPLDGNMIEAVAKSVGL